MEENRQQFSGQQFQYSQQQQFQQRYQSEKKQVSESVTEGNCCHKCGAPVPQGNRFCEECGEPVENNLCPHCNARLTAVMEICPYCGKPIDVTRCTFCGGILEEGDNFCCDCGNPVHGIKCPVCGTTNFHNFCRNCNSPLTELAQIQLNRVKNDPRVIKAQQLALELEELEKKIMALQQRIGANGNDGVFQRPQSTLSEEDRKILETYSNLFGKGVSSPKPLEKSQLEQKYNHNQHSETKKTNQNKGSGSSGSWNSSDETNAQIEQLKEQYHQKVKEMGASLLDLLPDPQDPPIIQRDFLCACKVVTVQKVQKKELAKIGWVCNYCGYQHKQPSECARPFLGGKWVYNEITVWVDEVGETTVYL